MLAGEKPPTTNDLSDGQRVRMLRSVRKLGMVMGTSPLLVDQVSPRMAISERKESSAYKRKGGIYTVTSTSLQSSVSSIGSTCPRYARLTLSPESRIAVDSAARLRLVLTLTQPTDDLDLPGPSTSTDSLAILSRSLSFLLTVSASDHRDPEPLTAHAARRRKMLKLVHLLGGPIPTALVFPPPLSTPLSSSTPATSSRHRRRSRSVPPPEAARKLARSRPQPPLPSAGPETFSTAALRISRPRPLAPLDPHMRHRHPGAATDSSAQRQRERRRRSRSVTPPLLPLSADTPGRPYNLRRKSRIASEESRS